MEIEELASQIVDSAFKVHSALGPGLLESAYQACMVYELRQRGIPVEAEVTLPLCYKDVRIDAGYRLDMLVGDLIIIENKAVESILPIHEAQMITYLKLSQKQLGFLINWNVPLIKQGIKRMVYQYAGNRPTYALRRPKP